MAKKKLAVAEKVSTIPPRGYPDLHDHLEQLEREGLLIRIKEPVDKDQEMHPLVRWQFRGGIKEKDRKAFLFEQPVDAKGTRYDIPVAIGILAGFKSRIRDTTGSWSVPSEWYRAGSETPAASGRPPNSSAVCLVGQGGRGLTAARRPPALTAGHFRRRADTPVGSVSATERRIEGRVETECEHARHQTQGQTTFHCLD